jgi:glycosyltransferase involved in cell wall biosynthesis
MPEGTIASLHPGDAIIDNCVLKDSGWSGRREVKRYPSSAQLWRDGTMQPSLPLVTIAIPTYNRADNYLPQALASAQSQTYPNIEIIVSDNCSSDHTETLMRGISDARIRYFRQEKNIGANNNFNFCLQQSKGIYFLFLHDDDLIDHDLIETCMNANSHNGDVGFIRTGMRLIDSEGRVLREVRNIPDGTSMDTFFLSWFKGKIPMYCCNTLFHTEKLRLVGGFNSKYNLLQDVKAEVQLAAMFGREDIQDIKASCRYHERKFTHQTRVIDWCDESLILLDLMCNLVSENKILVHRQGMRFFANLGYRRATEVRSLRRRILCYLIVLQKFRYRYPPPPVYRLLRLHRRIYHLMAMTPVAQRIRSIGAKMRR